MNVKFYPLIKMDIIKWIICSLSWTVFRNKICVYSDSSLLNRSSCVQNSEHKTTTTTSRTRESLRGPLTDLYDQWELPLKDLIVLYDRTRTDLLYSLMRGLPPTTETLYMEITDKEGIHKAFTRAVYNSDSRNVLFVTSTASHLDLTQEIMKLKKNLPSNIWIFVSTSEQNLQVHICRMHEEMNIFVMEISKDSKGNTTGDEADYSALIKECPGNESSHYFRRAIEWSSVNGVEKNYGFSKIPSKRVILRVVALHEAPFIYVDGEGYTGYHMDILEQISKIVGFEYVVMKCDNDLYGFLNESNNQWSGCVSDLVYGRADIVAAPLHLLSVREAVIDYVIPWSGYSGIVILAPKQDRELFFFMQVFSPELWAAIAATLVISSLLVYGFGQALVIYDVQQEKTYDDRRIIHNKSNFHDAVWFFMSSATFEGARRFPQSHATRILIAGFWFFVQVVMSIFIGNMAAFLMSSVLKTEIRSFADLIGQNTVKFSCWRDSSVSAHIRDMSKIEKFVDSKWTRSNLDGEILSASDYSVWTNPLSFKYTKLWDKIVRYGFVNTTTEALEKISAGNFMFVTDSAIAEFLAVSDCSLQTIGRRISSRPYGFGIRKHSAMKDLISNAYLTLQHSSAMHEIRQKWWKSNKHCPGLNQDEGLQLPEMAGTFYFVIVGATLGLFCLLSEIMYVKCLSKKHKASTLS